jgi:XTP/dITP diphosphohydrolase
VSAAKRIVFASGNAGKAREVRALFQELFGDEIELVLQGELGVAEVEETGTTFVANALLKARHAAAVTGLPALADDSGLAVDALDGKPGVYSARYAGVGASDSANVAKLLLDLQAVPADQRAAQFRCVLAYVRAAADPEPVIAEGAWQGSIASAATGGSGFGYDPVFIDSQSGRTAAELSAAEKNARSHRGQALASFRELLGAEAGSGL